MQNTRSIMKSGGQKKAKGAVNIRNATSSLMIPTTIKNQKSKGMVSSMAPTSMASQQRVRGPRSRSSDDGRMIVVSKRELISSITGSTAFTVTKLSVNPGLSAVFPWLSKQAQNWEQYRFRRLSFEYVTRTATTTVGSVILAPDYDPEDGIPTSEAQLTSFEDAVEDAPWKNISCVIKPQNITPGPRKFIRDGAEAGDIKNYDALNFYIGTVDFSGAVAAGKLWVDYEVELHIPQVESGSSQSASRTSLFTQIGVQAFATTVNEAIDFEPAPPGKDPLGIGNPVLGVFTPPRGTYRLDYFGSFSDSVAESLTVIVDVFKNGVLNGPRSVYLATASAGADVPISGFDIVSCNGTDTVQVMVNMTGAAGVLQLNGNSSAVIWSIA